MQSFGMKPTGASPASRVINVGIVGYFGTNPPLSTADHTDRLKMRHGNASYSRPIIESLIPSFPDHTPLRRL